MAEEGTVTLGRAWVSQDEGERRTSLYREEGGYSEPQSTGGERGFRVVTVSLWLE